jgi:rhomboid protease GluP
VVAATALLSFGFLRSSHQDGAAYSKKVDEVQQIEAKALAPFQSYASDADLLSKLSRVSQVEWAKAKTIMDETEGYQLDAALAKHRKLLREYVDLRIRHTDLAIIALQGREKVDAELDAVAKQINEKIEEMQKR